jgi:hypothetical protein
MRTALKRNLDELVPLVERLCEGRAIDVRGAAMTARLVSDTQGPLYRKGDLRHALRAARMALDERELDRHERVDPGGVAPQLLHGVAQGHEVDDRRHAGEVLHERARAGRRSPVTARLSRTTSPRLGALVLAVTEQVLEEHVQRVWQARHVVPLLERVEPEDLVRLAADVERRTGPRAARRAHGATGVSGLSA